MPTKYHRRKVLLPSAIGLLVVFFALFNLTQQTEALPLYDDPSLFVTRWQTNVTGATEPTKVTLAFKEPLVSMKSPWKCDNVFEDVYDSKITHDYQEAGTFDVCIRTTDPFRLHTPNLADDEKAKLLEIRQWGHVSWSSFDSVFRGTINMQLTATDSPDLSAAASMNFAFADTTNFSS